MKRSLLLASILFIAACDSQSLTAPSLNSPKPSSDQVSVMSITQGPLLLDITAIYFGVTPIDSLRVGLGQSSAISPESVQPVFLKAGQKANVVASLISTKGLESSDKLPATLTLLTDWQAVNPSAHRGVVYDSASDVFFTGFKQTGPNSFSNVYFLKHLSHPGKTTLTFPAGLWVAWASQRYKVGCAGNDSLTFRSNGGFGQIFDDVNGESAIVGSTVQELTVHCTVYPNASEARAAVAKLTL